MSDLTRRNFIKALGMSGVAASYGCNTVLPQSQPPEISASVFPWDLADEGIENVLDNLQGRAGANSIYMCNLSQSIRPFRGGEYTHNPVRKSYTCEDCHIYWKPDMKHYGKIKPLRTKRDFLAKSDWVEDLTTALRKRKMKSAVELFHAWIDPIRLQEELPDAIQINVFGKPVITHNYKNHVVCHNSPEFQEYAVGLYSDLAANYDLDYIQTCLVPYVLPTKYFVQNLPPDPIEWALVATEKGGCFCNHCVFEAKKKGFDLKEAQKELQVLAKQDKKAIMDSGITAEEYLKQNPVLKRWLDFRCESINNFFHLISSAAKSFNPNIDIRWNHYVRTHSYYSGVDLPSFMNHIDSIRANAFVEHQDNMKLVHDKVKYLENFENVAGDHVHWVAALDIRGKNPAVLEKSAELSSYTGCDGYALSHYGGAQLKNLDAVKRGLQKSKWSKHFK
ncbi:hypothetical protein LNTAR_07314 [Lentisphaera araneosa HTCC2155]|uniref:Uncharacterized protein n=1 Tax=Lentisphaera araneosa HTCC2155 TaxID=313628 RepID=A6DMZ8_9BACT|nr:hypothetical protein [Lentisphaera araneosa]EDM27034.1 hypothetical protein LNTAR_07314 [Lentisphaera araneosa HTCC2155]